MSDTSDIYLLGFQTLESSAQRHSFHLLGLRILSSWKMHFRDIITLRASVSVFACGDTQTLSPLQPYLKSPLNTVKLAWFTAIANVLPHPIVTRARGGGVLDFVCICGRDVEYKDVIRNVTPQRSLSWLFAVEALERALGWDYIRRRNPGDSCLAQFHPRAH